MRDTSHVLGVPWSFERRVSSAHGELARMRGTASIEPSPVPGMLAYREVSEVTSAGSRATLAATRTHAVRLSPGHIEVHVGVHSPAPTGDSLLYRFACPSAPGDERVFPILSTSSHVHRCGEDMYGASLCILTPGALRLTERVRGPRKGYAITTDYRRLVWGGDSLEERP